VRVCHRQAHQAAQTGDRGAYGTSPCKLVVKTGAASKGTLTYMLEKKRCVAFLSANNLYTSITSADDSKCQR
jgi:hypothetical protein